MAKELAALTTDDIITGNQNALAQKITFPVTTSEDSRASSALLSRRLRPPWRQRTRTPGGIPPMWQNTLSHSRGEMG
jgi:hypothetical protein